MNLDALKAQIIAHEGIHNRPYQDTRGYLTIGVGHCLDAKPLSKAAVMAIFNEDLADTMADLAKRAPWYTKLDDVRQRVLIDMAFNLGIGGLLAFTKMLAAVERGDYIEAADEMLSSKWSGQVGARARRLAEMMVTGKEAKAQE